MSYPPIWVVNLARSRERHAYITAHLTGLGLSFEVVSAIDGNELSSAELSEIYSPDQATTTIGYELAPGEIGCALSHLQLYRRMLDNGDDVVLILEDDAVVHPDTLTLLNNLQELPFDWDILLLHHLPKIGGSLSHWNRRMVANRWIGRFSMPAYGTAGYLIRNSAARKLLSQAYPIRAPADYWTGGRITANIRIYGVEPPCIAQLPLTNPGASTIPDRELYWKQAGMPELPSGLGLYFYRLKVWLIKIYYKYHP